MAAMTIAVFLFAIGIACILAALWDEAKDDPRQHVKILSRLR
jgi:hypothetical protein